MTKRKLKPFHQMAETDPERVEFWGTNRPKGEYTPDFHPPGDWFDKAVKATRVPVENPAEPKLDPEAFAPSDARLRDDLVRGAIQSALADLSLAMESRDNTDALERAQRVLEQAARRMLK